MRLVPVTDDSVAVPVTGTGVVAAKEEIPLGFKIGGVLLALDVHEGDRVRAGQTLAALDLREIDALVTKARSAAAKAERDHARVRALFADSVASLAQLQDTETALEVARADLQAAQVNQRYATIVAPSDGVVLRRLAEPGQTVAPGAPVVVLGSAAHGTVLRVGLADRDVVRVRIGDRAMVRVDAWPDRALGGTVRQIAAAATPGTGTYAVEIALDSSAGVASGMVGHAEIAVAARARVPVVPVEALLEADGDRAAVYTLGDDGLARRVPVRVAWVRGDRVALRDVEGGLAGVRAVVTDGAAYLEDGARARVRP